MFGFGGILPMLLVLVSLGGGVVWYYNDTQERIATLRENNATLEAANRTNTETIAQLQADSQLMQELNNELVAKMNAAEEKVDALRDKLIDHDLTKLSLKKPGLIEKRINAGTNEAFDYLESITAGWVQPIASTGDQSSDGNEGSQTTN